MRVIPHLIGMVFAMNAFEGEDLRSVEAVAKCSVTKEKKSCKASPALQKVFTALGLRGPPDFSEVVADAQKSWLRPKGVERWQMTERYTDKRETLLPLFRELGLVENVHATQKKYDYAAIHGATLLRVESRINWLVAQWNKGVRFKELVFLSGVRELDAALEVPEVKKRWRCCEIWPTNETQMIKWLWYKMKVPKEMRALPLTFVNAKASEKRAHTGDTVIDWIAQKPKAGSVLAVSSQPFVSYQDITMRNRLPASFSLETIGDAAPDDVMNVVYLDNLARLLFEIKKWES